MDVKKALCATTENKYQRKFYAETISKQYNDASLEKQYDDAKWRCACATP